MIKRLIALGMIVWFKIQIMLDKQQGRVLVMEIFQDQALWIKVYINLMNNKFLMKLTHN